MNILLRTCCVPGAGKVLMGVRWMRSVPWWNPGGVGRTCQADQDGLVWLLLRCGWVRQAG